MTYTWTGVSDRPNSDAGTEGMIRALHEYRDVWGPNEIVAPRAVIYEYPEIGAPAMWAPDAPHPVPEPAAFLLVLFGLLFILIGRQSS